VAPSKHRAELQSLWRRLDEGRGGGERGAGALDACLGQSSALPVRDQLVQRDSPIFSLFDSPLDYLFGSLFAFFFGIAFA